MTRQEIITQEQTTGHLCLMLQGMFMRAYNGSAQTLAKLTGYKLKRLPGSNPKQTANPPETTHSKYLKTMKKQFTILALTAALCCGTAGAQSGVKYPYITTATGGVVIVLRDDKGGVDEAALFSTRQTASPVGDVSSTANLMSRKFRVQKAQGQSSNVKWADAKSYCENLNTEGYSDWRLPTQRELMLIWTLGGSSNVTAGDKNDTGVGSGSVPLYTPYLYQQGGFTAFSAGHYWSASQSGSPVVWSWSVSFNDGYTEGYNFETYSRYVRCVRDEW